MTALRPYDLRHAAIIATVSAIGILLPKSRAPPRPGTCSAEREGFEPRATCVTGCFQDRCSHPHCLMLHW
jgi:hypothetical protein